MKRIRPVIALAGVVLGAGLPVWTLTGRGAFAQDPEPTPECDLARIEKLDFCVDCQTRVEKDALNEKGEHRDCGKKPVKADYCVKTYYLCEACGAQSDEAGKCPNCKADLKERESPSRIIFICRKCGSTSDEPKPCDQEGCPAKGADRVKSCEDSGIPPHVPKK